MKKAVMLEVSVLLLVFLVFSLSGCVTGPSGPSIYSNPYLSNRTSEYDLIEVSVNPSVMLTMGNYTSIFNDDLSDEHLNDLKSISPSLLSVTVSCREDAKYEVYVSDEETEYRMIFSGAWNAQPTKEEQEMKPFFDFSITKNSEVYLYEKGIKLIDGPNGNTAATITTTVGSATVVRGSSYISSLPVGNHVYTNVLRVNLLFSGSDPSNGNSPLELVYFFDKSVGLIKFDSYLIYDSNKIPLMSVDLIKTNIGTYEIGPSPATNLEPNNTPVSKDDVVFTWSSTETTVTYNLIYFNSNGDSTEVPSLPYTTYDAGPLDSDSYLWTIVTVGSNGLSTISQPAFFIAY